MNIPIPWFVQDVIVVAITLIVVVFIIKKSKHPVQALLEGFCFVFLYAGIFENFAVIMGWYVYGRSLLMFIAVPLSVPLIEMDVFIVGLWMLEKVRVPDWCKPFIMGLLGMLQDFSLDPLATHQVYTVDTVTSGRWTWILTPGAVNIYGIPVYNFPGWMLIMLYATIFVILGRRWFKRSGYKASVGNGYPFASLGLALLAMMSPVSNALLWLVGFQGSVAEWVMLSFHLAFPTVLLIMFWRGKMNQPISIRQDLPIFAVPVVFHVSDIIFTIAGGFIEVLWLVVLASCLHVALLVIVCVASQRARRTIPVQPAEAFLFEP
nr:carotenoid biosynthesis protein [Candidatus Sigynarchaeota archaeon]